jgi:poly(A) polymerase
MSKVHLPDAPWRQSEGLRAVLVALTDDGQPPRVVGGAVRDSLFGLPVADVDLATPLLPDAVIRRLESAGIKAVPTGLDHGTITAVAAGQNFEITTLRRDVATDGRRAVVAFSTDWHEDAARRDFTINALYADPASGEVFDYFGGLDDLEAGMVRFIGDADTRIAEDHLRILRYFRFHARFGKAAPDPVAIAACAKSAKSLMALSRERILDELSKLLALPDPLASIALMIEHGIFAAFLPELIIDAEAMLRQLLEREASVGAAADFGRRLNAILPFEPATVEKVAARLKMSNRLRQEMVLRASIAFPEYGDPQQCAQVLAYRHGLAIARDLCLLCGTDAQWRVAFQALNDWQVPVFPIGGGQLIKRGLTAGPVVAACLKSIEEKWIAEGFPDEDRTGQIADQCVVAMLSSKKE